MLVRCGRCRIELEVTGPGEFLCPSCGTRNVVHGDVAGQDTLDLPDLGGAPAPEGPSSVRWLRCPDCAYRFAVGEVQEVSCPSCGRSIDEIGPS